MEPRWKLYFLHISSCYMYMGVTCIVHYISVRLLIRVKYLLVWVWITETLMSMKDHSPDLSHTNQPLPFLWGVGEVGVGEAGEAGRALSLLRSSETKESVRSQMGVQAFSHVSGKISYRRFYGPSNNTRPHIQD